MPATGLKAYGNPSTDLNPDPFRPSPSSRIPSSPPKTPRRHPPRRLIPATSGRAQQAHVLPSLRVFLPSGQIHRSRSLPSPAARVSGASDTGAAPVAHGADGSRRRIPEQGGVEAFLLP